MEILKFDQTKKTKTTAIPKLSLAFSPTKQSMDT